MTTLVLNHLPLVNLLKDMFKSKPIKPNHTQAEIMYTAGQQSILEFLDGQIQTEEEQQLQFK